jgi:hypothetical protein
MRDHLPTNPHFSASVYCSKVIDAFHHELSTFNSLMQIFSENMFLIDFFNIYSGLLFSCFADFGFEVDYGFLQFLLSIIRPHFPQLLAKFNCPLFKSS